ncbi:MAG: hypothetical protein Q7W02_06400 [Candidatus Rokubacteria bacterium]|nr:hypothetical protein [Candidatus Rokubacteria bacterium]
MKLRLLLAHFAEVQSSMLYALGMGWTQTGPAPSPFAICGVIEVTWEETNRAHTLEISILDADGQPFMVPTPMGEQPFRLQAQFDVGRPPGSRAGSPFVMPLAMNVQPLAFRAGQDYVVRGTINGDLMDEVPFLVRAQPPAPPPQIA